MPDTFALFLAIGIIGTSVALATAILFDDSRTKQRSIEHYRNMERQRAHRMRRTNRARSPDQSHAPRRYRRRYRR
jgi:hypothetical protein